MNNRYIYNYMQLHKIIEKVRRGSGRDDVIFCSEGGLSSNDGRI